MKKIAAIGLIVVAASLLLVPQSEADGRRGPFRARPAFHSRVVIGFGPAFYYGPYPYPYYYYPPYPPPVVYTPPPVVIQETPPVYVQQAPPPQAAAPAPSQELYWYYCQSANGYYPTVQSCSEAWVKVPPRP